jgi:hypothetical protein
MQCQPERRELRNASPEFHDLLSQALCCTFVPLQTDHLGRARDEPPTCRREPDPEIRRDRQFPSTLDKIPKPVVVVLLRAPRSRHADDHRRFVHTDQPLEDTSNGPPLSQGHR